jgi:cytidylate kinase
LDVRAKRVARRENKEYGRALEETRNREESEIRRYRHLYNIDMHDLTPYNVVIDTTLWNAGEVADIVGSILSLTGVKR